MKNVVCAFIATVVLFLFALFLVLIANQGTYGVMILFAIIFILTFIGMYCVFKEWE